MDNKQLARIRIEILNQIVRQGSISDNGVAEELDEIAALLEENGPPVEVAPGEFSRGKARHR